MAETDRRIQPQGVSPEVVAAQEAKRMLRSQALAKIEEAISKARDTEGGGDILDFYRDVAAGRVHMALARHLRGDED